MRLIFALFLLFVSAQANAVLLSFTGRGTFESQLSGFQTLDFDDFFYRPLPLNYVYGDTTLFSELGPRFRDTAHSACVRRKKLEKLNPTYIANPAA